MNIDQLVEYISDAVVDEIKGQSSSLNTSKTLSNFRQAQLLSETLGLTGVFKQRPVVEGIKVGNANSGNHGHGGRPGAVGGSGEGDSAPLSQSGSTKAKKEALILYSGGFIDAHKIVAMSSAYIKGEDIGNASVSSGAADNHIDAAKLLVDAIRSVPESDTKMFRSLQFGQDSNERALSFKKILDDCKVGQAITLDRISSFSTDRTTAAFYSPNEDKAVNYEFVVIGKNKSLPTDRYTGMVHKERITEGQFEIVKIEGPSEIRVANKYEQPINYTKTITLKQTGVF